MSKFNNAKDALVFIRGGNAVFTIKSLKTGSHFTYKVTKGKEGSSPYFVRVLAGPDNQDWAASQYIGLIPNGQIDFYTQPLIAGRKGKPKAPSYLALSWVLNKLSGKFAEVRGEGEISGFEIMHEGRCCRCNRALTHPDSIESGIGPECAKRA